MPKFHHYVCTGYGVSAIFYGGKRIELAGIGQGNKFSGDMCQNILCLIIWQLEKENLEITMRSVISNKQELCSSISFVDDTDLVEDRPDSQMKM